MNPGVPDQVAVPDGRVITVLAPIQILSRVDSVVSGEVTFSSGTVLTKRAFMWFVTCVNLAVLHQMSTSGCFKVTRPTLVGLPSIMNRNVFH